MEEWYVIRGDDGQKDIWVRRPHRNETGESYTVDDIPFLKTFTCVPANKDLAFS